MQRLRLEFGRGPRLKYLSHLDLLRLWERAIRRAGIPLAYSEGFTPHPRLSLAAPLPVGVTAEAELADIWLSHWTSPADVLARLSKCFPPGLEVKRAWPVAPEEDSLQAHMESAEYEVVAMWPQGIGPLPKAVADLLAVSTYPWKQQRGAEVHAYDLRPMVISLETLPSPDGQSRLRMVLACGSRGSGRPEQITLALGFPEPPLSINRRRLFLAAGTNLLP